MDGIQLSSELITDIKSVLQKHDNTVENDFIFLQYLAAMSGFVLAHQNEIGLNKPQMMSELHEFSGQVLNQVETDLHPHQPSTDAFGTWKPGDG